MDKQDRELLLKDLSARLPYGVKISLNTEGIQNIGVLDALYPNDECIIVDYLEKRFPLKNGYGTVDYGRFSLEESNFKPYLRPMSSMTEEEKKELGMLGCEGNIEHEHGIFYRCQDLLNRNHFDYRGLIPKGLAIEAPKNMYENLE